MGFFDFMKGPDINEGVKKYKETEHAVLLDVRTEEEYLEGRIPESRNLPLQKIQTVSKMLPDREQPVFIYCHSGIRSRQAVFFLKEAGYTSVTDLGGIISYKGNIIK